MTDVAVLGTGHMGAAVTRRLLATGHRVTVWNRTPRRAAALARTGAQTAASPADTVAGADLVITTLTDGTAVHDVLFTAGKGDCAITAMRPGTVVVQMSTIGLDETHRINAQLPVTMSFLDAPVGGSVGAAEAGRLTIFAGGRDDAIDRAEPVLRHLGTIRRCGPVGTGTALKLVVNTALVTALAALHDTLAVADAVGVDRAVAVESLAAGPLGGVIRRATATDASFAISLAVKDAHLALRELQAGAPVAAAAANLLHAAADQQADVSSLISSEAR